ncbi:MAG: DNA-3-methyladenine glycosylase I [Sphingobacteriales bacterium]|nr:MAG: DNA-3-methyladenine glycosylase I [Sphingobacteriales bacterium]
MQFTRCPWCVNNPLYTHYHDTEWGKVISDDRILFEFLILESAQAGLSWITILRKRENYRRLFANFDPVKVASFTQKNVDEIMQDAGIIRNRLKINAAISNAKIFLNLKKEHGSFYNYLYSFMPNGKPIIHNFENIQAVPTTSIQSDAIAKDLKKRGFKFFGSVICYAFMQATGMINDHLTTCSFR